MNDAEKALRELLKNIKGVGLVVGILVLLVVGKSTFYTVEPDEEAVVIRFGKFVGTNPPGLHFKLPIGIDEVFFVKTKRVLQEEFGFRTKNVKSRRTEYSRGNYDNESLMLTGDLNVADVEWVVQFQISDPFKFLFQTSRPKANIRDVSESIMRRVVGDRSVTEVLTTGRVEIANEAQVLMQDVLDKYDMGIKIVTVKLQDVNPPNAVKPSFNEVNEAKQEQEKVINQAEEAYNKVIPEAKGKAEKVISEAEGYAEALINESLGDAEKFAAILKEYKRAPLITRKRIYLETMEDIYKRMSNLTIVDPKIQGLLPVFGKMLEDDKAAK
ncbi:MAG: FtsH protease activity modulator HflK [Halobacteriovorax sp.]|nr:FtsH protease activity modulator HflK [Halobacteriovorax sp.]|tara:strand:- start:191412 stop:192392 length:981 start_codon:yes stop_codon:yes gene_type:complete